MARYTNYDELLKRWHDLGLDEISKIHKVNAFNHFIKTLPIADVVEVKHGEWETVVVYNDTCIATCSSCRQPIVERECNATAFKLENEFCRKCGAKMDGERRDAE